MDPRQFLPLTPHAFHVLLSLIGGELHGYGIILDVQERTGGDDRLRTGTLYTILRRLVEDGLITESEPRVLDDADERRRYYAHTPLGLAVTKTEAVRLDRLVQLPRDKRVLPAARPALSRGSNR
ncbi:PadR family transcriptional regulator [soil metagenome]